MALKENMVETYLSWRKKAKDHNIALKNTISWAKGTRHFHELYDNSEIDETAKEIDDEWKNKDYEPKQT